MLILGIDPGLQKTGWGLVFSEGHKLSFRACGLIRTETTSLLGERLAHIHRELKIIIEQWQPQGAAIEETFMNNNAASALKLGQARGVAMTVPALFGLEVAEYSANKIKKSITGNGHAAKNQMGVMVKMLLPTCGTPSADEADALAVAICHAHHGTWNKKMRALA
jgi:crossover junction endodeoxyribonuclease RuvC